jgi:RpiR family carbohydrate utilization transcriptional regulator
MNSDTNSRLDRSSPSSNGEQPEAVDDSRAYAMLAQLRELRPSLSKSERKVADLVLAHPNTVVNSTMANVARQAGVSEPSVVRFCRTTGSSGFSHFKLRLAQSLATGVPYVHRDVNPNEPTADLAVKILDRSIAALIKMRHSLNPETLDRAIGLLADARRIDFYGSGSSGIVAADAQHKFQPLGAPSVAYADPHLQSTSAATLKRGDVVVVISSTGRTRDMLQNVTLAIEAGAQVIGITPSDSPLARLCTLSLSADVSEDADIYIPMATRIAQLAIIDILAVGVALRRGPALINRLEQLKKILREKRVPRER